MVEFKPYKRPAAVLLFIMSTVIASSVLTSLLRIDVKEAFECWCRNDSPTATAISPAIPTVPVHVELLGAPVTLTVAKQFAMPLPVFGTNPFQYTLSFWIKIKDLSSIYRSVIRFGPDDSNRQPAVFVAPNSTSIHYRHASTADKNQGFDAIVGIPQNTWGHFAMVVSGRTMTPYINGKQVTQMTALADLVPPSDKVYIPQDPATNVDASKPLAIAYVWHANVALSAQDILNVYNAPHTGAA